MTSEKYERNKLTAVAANKAKPGYHADGGGLYLQVSKTRSKSWIYRFSFGGKRREMGLGPYPAVSLSRARAARDGHEEHVKHGLDPIVTRIKVDMTTFASQTKDAFDALKHSLKGDGKAGRWMSPMNVHVLPQIGDRDITGLDQNDIAKLLRPIWRTKVSAAEKALQRIKIVLNYAEAAGLDVDPRIADKAKHLLGDQGHAVQNIPSMPWQELPAFYAKATMNSL